MMLSISYALCVSVQILATKLRFFLGRVSEEVENQVDLLYIRRILLVMSAMSNFSNRMGMFTWLSVDITIAL